MTHTIAASVHSYPSPEAPTPAPADAGLLIAEEDDGVCELLRMVFGRAVSRILTAHLVGPAIELLAERHPGAIILSLDLPDASGPEALERVRAAAPQTPVIATVKTELYADDPFVLAEAFSLFLKPFDLPRLRMAVQAALKREHNPGGAGKGDIHYSK